jgi:pimeloyl-ACP methyl ester carboxylesterase
MAILSLFFLLFSLLVGATAAVVLLSYAIAWYEYANRQPELLDRRFDPGRMGLACRLLLQETFFLLVTVLQHPLGWLRQPEKLPEYGSGTPVLLLHGLFHNRACWGWLRGALRRRGLGSVQTMNLPPWFDVETLVERIDQKVDALRHASGANRVHLVGHSMGAMLARHYLQLRGGAEKVASCTLLGAPNGGSRLVPFALTPLGELLLPGSEFLERLAETPLPQGIPLRNIYSRHDNMVIPFENCHLEGAENVELSGLGHAALLYHPHAVEAIYDALAEAAP